MKVTGISVEVQDIYNHSLESNRRVMDKTLRCDPEISDMEYYKMNDAFIPSLKEEQPDDNYFFLDENFSN